MEFAYFLVMTFLTIQVTGIKMTLLVSNNEGPECLFQFFSKNTLRKIQEKSTTCQQKQLLSKAIG